MNIDDYRAMKAQEEKQPEDSTKQVEQPVEDKTPTQQEETKQSETKESAPVTKIEVNGEEIDIEEIKKGYLRQSDYTKKAQELSKLTKENQDAIRFWQHLKSNPELAAKVKQTTVLPRALDPTTAKIVELENRMYDMILDQEINRLAGKYPDFDVREVLQIADKKKITNLEDAYLLSKAGREKPIDTEALKKQIRDELLKELTEEGEGTKTVITSGNVAPVVTTTPNITDEEKRIAGKMKLSVEDYIKWRDVGKKRKK